MNDSTVYVVVWCCRSDNINTDAYVAHLSIAQLVAGIQENVLAGISLGQSYPNLTSSEAIIPYSLPRNYNKASIFIREITKTNQ